MKNISVTNIELTTNLEFGSLQFQNCVSEAVALIKLIAWELADNESSSTFSNSYKKYDEQIDGQYKILQQAGNAAGLSSAQLMAILKQKSNLLTKEEAGEVFDVLSILKKWRDEEREGNSNEK